MLSCFASGYRLVMMHKWSPERALELVERERVTNFVGVPTMVWDLLESPDFARRDTSSLQNVGGGLGTPITDDLGVTNDYLLFNKYGPEYNDTLPSLNLAFELTDNDILRFAAAKVKIGRAHV